MKKLLGILGTITIVGSGMTGIIANKPYSVQQKEIKLLNSEINYLQENNNLENLKRNKRQNEVDLRRTLISSSFIIITNIANWGRNFAIQIGSDLCLKIKNSSTSIIESGLKYMKEAVTGAAAGIGASYTYHQLSGNNETYSYFEAAASGAAGSTWHVSAKISSDIIEGFNRLLTAWKENPQSFKDIIVSNYIVGKGLLISFLNDAVIPRINNNIRAVEV